MDLTIVVVILLWPWMLLSLLVVAAAAMWALFRPGRQLAVVGSLELWQQAMARLDRSVLSRSRKVSAAWWCLLIGALVAGGALSRPVYRSSPPVRQIAIGIIPSAELGDKSNLSAAVDGLLNRLSADDHIRLVLPTIMPQPGGWLTAGQVREQMAQMPILPAAADQLELAPVGETVQHTFVFGPAGTTAPSARDTTFMGVQPKLPDATIDALGASPLPDGQVQMFIAIRNQTGRALSQAVSIRGHAGKGRFDELQSLAVNLTPLGRQQFVVAVQPVDAYEVALLADGKPIAGGGTTAWLARQSGRQVKVAMLGVDEPLVRRLVQVHAGLKLVGEKDAEIFIANGVNPPPGRPALVINPAKPPTGWSRGHVLHDVRLADAKIAQHPIMKNVSLAGEVRSVQPWTPAEDAEGKVVARLEQGAIILDDDDRSIATQFQVRRVYVAFDVGASNCTWSMRTSFVVFLANVIEYLAPAGQANTAYSYRSPLKAAGLKTAGGDSAQTTLPSPGLYPGEGGGWQAVSLVGLGAGEMPTSAPGAANIVLPQPRLVQADHELWPALAGIAAALWLAGWFLRSRE